MSDDRTVIVDRGGGGSTAIVALIIVLLLAVAAWYFLLGPGAGTTPSQGSDVDVDVNLPSVEVPQSS